MIKNINHKSPAKVISMNTETVSVSADIEVLPLIGEDGFLENSTKVKKEVRLSFEEWTLPPQPEGYIQYPPFDPF